MPKDLNPQVIRLYNFSKRGEFNVSKRAFKAIICVAILIFFIAYTFYNVKPRINIDDPFEKLASDCINLLIGLGGFSIFTSFVSYVIIYFILQEIIRMVLVRMYKDLDNRVKSFKSNNKLTT